MPELGNSGAKVCVESSWTAVLPRLSVGTVAGVKEPRFPRPSHARIVLPESCVLRGFVDREPAGELKGTKASACAPTVGAAVAAVTVKVVLLLTLPSITVMVMLPTPTAVARPLDEIVTTLVFEELQVSPLVST